mmetsp:Transcript_18923/g.28023  ORF Transcript_18923/g.28023 Transcript_18923/m.28023 type:complete len:117 (+) Transcript_18923:709-1059(+)
MSESYPWRGWSPRKGNGSSYRMPKFRIIWNGSLVPFDQRLAGPTFPLMIKIVMAQSKNEGGGDDDEGKDKQRIFQTKPKNKLSYSSLVSNIVIGGEIFYTCVRKHHSAYRKRRHTE